MSEKYRIRTLDRSREERIFNADTQSDVIAKVTRYLINEKNLINKISPLPYTMGQMERAIINDEPKYPDGERDMIQYRKVGDYYLDTHASRETKKRQVLHLAAECDVDVYFQGDW